MDTTLSTPVGQEGSLSQICGIAVGGGWTLSRICDIPDGWKYAGRYEGGVVAFEIDHAMPSFRESVAFVLCRESYS